MVVVVLSGFAIWLGGPAKFPITLPSMLTQSCGFLQAVPQVVQDQGQARSGTEEEPPHPAVVPLRTSPRAWNFNSPLLCWHFVGKSHFPVRPRLLLTTLATASLLAAGPNAVDLAADPHHEFLPVSVCIYLRGALQKTGENSKDNNIRCEAVSCSTVAIAHTLPR